VIWWHWVVGSGESGLAFYLVRSYPVWRKEWASRYDPPQRRPIPAMHFIPGESPMRADLIDNRARNPNEEQWCGYGGESYY
jgi:hypothetical protein